MIVEVFILFIILIVLYILFDWLSPLPLYWVWDDGKDPIRTVIDTDNLSFPKNFHWGVSTSAQQIEGYKEENSNWARWENGKGDKPRVKDLQNSKIACDHWNRVDEDTNLIKDLGANSYRFSVDWAKIEPIKGIYSSEALAHYEYEIKTLCNAGIRCLVTLHHFTHPLWFEQLGSFEKEENIEHFVQFAEVIFNKFSRYVKMWCTINEPTIYMAGAYILGLMPPGKNDIFLAGVVLKNLLNAHIRVYHRLKSLENGSDCQIGLAMAILPTEPFNRFNPFDILLSRIMDNIFNESTIKYLRTGSFKFSFFGRTYNNTKAKSSSDFIGLNYYSHLHAKFRFGLPPFEIVHPSRSLMTDMPYPIYPEGLYTSIRRISCLNVPIYITENGIADKEDSRRQLFLRRYLYAVHKAIQDGYDVRGYYYWSLLDNFEWGEGYSKCFGLYEVDFKTQKRTLREGAKYYKKVIEKFK